MTTGAFQKSLFRVVDSILAAAFVLIFLAFFVATLAINLVFNRRR